MNSAGDTEKGSDHSLPSCSEITNPDTNANLSLVQMDESKGAIPKTKPLKAVAGSKKANNNLEDSLPKRNGFKSYNSVYSDSDSDTESSRGFKRTASQEAYVYSSSLVTDTGASSTSCREASPKETDESSVSDDLGDDNDLSISDDGCFYTYKGDHVADLPNSFYHLEIQPMEEPPLGNGREANNSSPEMDFLEMDFDPGPSGDADSDSISNADMDNTENLPLDKIVLKQSDVLAKTSCFPQPRHLLPESASSGNEVVKKPQQVVNPLISNSVPLFEAKPCHSQQPVLLLPEIPSTSSSSSSSVPVERESSPAESRTSPLESKPPPPPEQPIQPTVVVEELAQSLILRMGSEMDEFYRKSMVKFNALQRELSLFDTTGHLAQPWSCTMLDRTRPAKTLRTIYRHQKGELTSPCDEFATQAGFDCSSKTTNKQRSSIRPMIWDEEEAVAKQITQVGPSACGATAVLNVLNALGYPIPTVEEVQNGVKTRLRASGSASLTEYLLSRSVAGCTHRDLIRGIYELSNRGVYSRFFAMYPERIVNLQAWLGYWISLGAVPVATLNLQKCEGSVPDSWHHQMIFGVDAYGIFLTNPLEHVNASQLFPQLSSEPVLLVRAEDVTCRYNPKRDYKELTAVDDVRWGELNVIGQVARTIREHRRSSIPATPHIRIPASYSAGITLSVPMDSPTFNLLRQCPELPLLHQEGAASAL